MMTIDDYMPRRRRSSNNDSFDYYGYSSTGKLHLCHKNGLSKCGMARVFQPFAGDPPSISMSDKCQRCFYIPAKKKNSVYKDLVDKDVKTWCGRIGIKL